MPGRSWRNPRSRPSGPFFTEQQPVDQWLVSFLFSEHVTNTAGETVGKINDLLVDDTGRIRTVVLGVGGFLGIGEKNVAVPYDTLTIGMAGDGTRKITTLLDRTALQQAPEFKAREKSTLTRAREKAGEMTEKAGRKIDEMRKGEPTKQ